MRRRTEQNSADYLYVRDRGTSGVLQLGDKEQPDEPCQVVDLNAARRVVWETYSERLLSRSRAVRERLADARLDVRPQVMEDLLLWIYRIEGVPVLLASEIARRIQRLLDQRSITRIDVDLSKDFPVESHLLAWELARLLPHVEVTPVDRKPPARHSRLMRRLALPLARICTWTILLAARLREGPSHPRIEQWPDEVFAVYPGWATHSRHVWKYLAQRRRENGDEVVFVLGNALRRARPTVPHQVNRDNVHFVRPLHRKDLSSCYTALKLSWPTASSLVTSALNDLAAGSYTRGRWLLKAAYFLLNALMVEAYVERLRPTSGGTVIFGVIASPVDTALDLALQHQNLTTIHWLHGIVAFGLQYRAHSTFCLCRSPLERELRTAWGAYGTCLSTMPGPEENLAYEPRDDKKGLLLLTNLIHRESPLPRESEAERELHLLLELTAQVAHAREEPLIWRPHPRERANRRLFSDAVRVAERFSYLIDGATDLATRFRTHRYAVCTFSTTIADAVQAGVVPALYAGTPHEQVGYWAALPEVLKFRNTEELHQVINRLDDPAFARMMHRRLTELFNVASQQPLALGSFAQLTRHGTEQTEGLFL